MSEPSPSSLSPPLNRARASSTSRRAPLTLHTCSPRKPASFSAAADPPSPDTPTSGTPPSKTNLAMALESMFSRSLHKLDFIRASHSSSTPSTDESLLPTMASSPTVSSFTDTLKDVDSPCTTRSPSVCIWFPVRVVDRVANASLFP